MCVVHQKSVNKLDLTWKQSFLISCFLSLCWVLWRRCWRIVEIMKCKIDKMMDKSQQIKSQVSLKEKLVRKLT